MENREAINLEFEFKSHKLKAKLRESELLEALSEKEKNISKLEKSLNSFNAQRLYNSKEELFQKSMIEDRKAAEDANVCIKCVDLQRLLEENVKVTLEFEKLTLVYESLKLNYDEIEKQNEASKLRITSIEEQQEQKKAECEKLLGEVQQLKQQLHDLQLNNGVLNSENLLKQEECLKLTNEVEAARQEMVLLEEKFSKLEVSWQEQQQTISDIASQYETIQAKYEQLQHQYEQLEATKDQPVSDLQRLEKENVDLQAEIEDLKEKVQTVQQTLLESTTKYEQAAKETKAANEVYSSKASKTQLENEQLRAQLQEIQAKFEELEKEYEDVSNQLIDYIQDCESLKNENLQLKKNLNGFESKTDHVSREETEINELESQLGDLMASNRKSILSPCRNVSMRSSGVCVDKEEEEEQEHLTNSTDYEKLFKKFSELSASLTQIEMVDAIGNKKLFKSVAKNSSQKSYKMCLKNISRIHSIPREFDMEFENIHLQGSCNYSFYIAELSGEDKLLETKSQDVEINGCASITEYVETLKQEILQLKSINEAEQQKKKSLLENTQLAISEMKEQIAQLSAELLEKSVFVENCACKSYQQEIENLKKEKANVTITCEELQEKMNSTLNASSQTNSTLQGVGDSAKELEELKQRELELLESHDSQTKMLEEITQRCVEVEAELENARELLKNQEKQHQESCNRLQLDYLQKLELSENVYRRNMKEYNKEWEEKQDEYDRIIKDLNRQINEHNQRVSVEEMKQEPVSDFEENLADIKEETDTVNDVLPAEIETTQSDTSRLREENDVLTFQRNVSKEHLKQLTEENHAKYDDATLRRELDDNRKDPDCIPVLHEKNQLLCDEIQELQNTLGEADFTNQEFCKNYTTVEKLSKTKTEEKSDITNNIELLNRENKRLLDALEKAEKLLENHQQGVCRAELMQTLQIKQERLALLEQEKECLANDLECLKEEYKQVNGKRLNSDQQIDELRNEILNREELLKTLQSIISPVKEMNDIPSNDFENLPEKYKQMQDKLLRTEQEIEALKKQTTSREEHLKTLEGKLDRLTLLEEEKKKLASNCENLKQEHKQLQDRLAKSEERIQELCIEDSSREVFLKSLQAKLCDLKAIEEEKKALEEEILRLKEFEEQGATSAKENETLKQQVKNLLKSQSEIEIKWQLEKSELDGELGRINNDCNLLRADKSSLEAKVSELTEEGKTLLEKCSQLEKEKTTLEEQLKCFKKKEEVQELLDQVIKEKSELVQALSLLREKLETAQNELRENEKYTSQIKEENQQIQKDLQKSLNQVIEEKTKELKVLTSENKQTELNNANLCRDVESLKRDLEKENKEKRDQQQKLEETANALAKLQCEKLEQQLLLKTAKELENNLRKEMQFLKESMSKMAEEKQQVVTNMEINLQKAQKENQELQLQLNGLNYELNKLREDQQTKMQEIAQVHADLRATKDSLTKLQEEHQNIQEKHKHCVKLLEDKNKLEATKMSQASLDDEKIKLQQYELQIKDFKEKETTFIQTIDSLSQQLAEIRLKPDPFQKLSLEHNKLKDRMTSTITNNEELQAQILQLKSQEDTHLAKISRFAREISELNEQVLKQEEEKQMLEMKFNDLKEVLQDEKCSLQKDNADLKGSLEELKLKFNSLKSTNAQLEPLNQQLQQQLNSANEKLKESYALQEKVKRLEVQHSQLQQSLKETVKEAGQCSLKLHQDVAHNKSLLQKQIEKYNDLSTEMTNKQHALREENLQLSTMIEMLTREKVELQDKLRQAAAARNFELDLQRQAADSSAATVASDLEVSHSSKEGIMLERLSNVSLEDKLCSKQKQNTTTKERKNRRLSAHDERRRQSYWGATHDKETMTEPADTSCNCLELDRKLRDCERNLFIKNSQVTALSMELKNHPLKEECAALKKRLQEERDKLHTEIKRCKRKLHEQTIKTEEALAASAHLTAKYTHAELLSERKTPTSAKVVADIETQTDDDLSASLQKLQGKYNDLKNICRFRYNHIKDLEEKVAQKENANGNSLSSLETVKMANTQNESLKHELESIKEKYEVAKKVLFSRRQEITKLRAQLEQNQ